VSLRVFGPPLSVRGCLSQGVAFLFGSWCCFWFPHSVIYGSHSAHWSTTGSPLSCFFFSLPFFCVGQSWSLPPLSRPRHPFSLSLFLPVRLPILDSFFRTSRPPSLCIMPVPLHWTRCFSSHRIPSPIYRDPRTEVWSTFPEFSLGSLCLTSYIAATRPCPFFFQDIRKIFPALGVSAPSFLP